MGKEVCLLVTFDPLGGLAEHAVVQAEAWAKEGFAVVLIVAVEDFSQPPAFDAPGCCEGVLVRVNSGYDFGAWASAIDQLPDIEQARMVVTANDSIYGPLEGFDRLLNRVRASDAAVVGAIGSTERIPHLQSFLIFFKAAALRHGAFKDFWSSVRTGDRRQVIVIYELRMQRYFERRHLAVEALFANTSGDNPTLTGWRALIEAGFPFLKVQLLRDNPFNADTAGWQEFVAARGFDPAIAERHLFVGSRRGSS